MLTKACFDRCMNTLLTFADVMAEPDKNKAFYALMKNDFTDEQFGKICEDICKTELLYGRYPAPKLFYDRKENTQEQILCEIGTLFVDDTFPEYMTVLSDLDQSTRDDVCNNVGNWLLENKRGEFVSKDFIIERLKQFRPHRDEEEPITLTEIKNLISSHSES